MSIKEVRIEKRLTDEKCGDCEFFSTVNSVTGKTLGKVMVNGQEEDAGRCKLEKRLITEVLIYDSTCVQPSGSYVNKTELYLSIKTEAEAINLARQQGFSEKVIKEFGNEGGWKEHYVNTGRQLAAQLK